MTADSKRIRCSKHADCIGGPCQKTKETTMPVKKEMSMPVYVPADKTGFLEEMKQRMRTHQSLHLGENIDVAVCVLTARELELLINLAATS